MASALASGGRADRPVWAVRQQVVPLLAREVAPHRTAGVALSRAYTSVAAELQTSRAVAHGVSLRPLAGGDPDHRDAGPRIPRGRRLDGQQLAVRARRRAEHRIREAHVPDGAARA